MSAAATIKRLGKRGGRQLLALLVLVGMATAALGSSAEAAYPDGAWLCSVPAGYTHSAVARNTGCAGGIQYRISALAEGRWVCYVPTGWAYNNITDTNTAVGPCQLGGVVRGQSMRLVKPVEGRWVCELPKNGKWTYYGTSGDTSSTGCRLGGGKTLIRLTAPAAGKWTCTVPSGFVAAQKKLIGAPNDKCLGMYHYQLRAV